VTTTDVQQHVIAFVAAFEQSDGLGDEAVLAEAGDREVDARAEWLVDGYFCIRHISLNASPPRDRRNKKCPVREALGVQNSPNRAGDSEV
jgi:hypothetical protein